MPALQGWCARANIPGTSVMCMVRDAVPAGEQTRNDGWTYIPERVSTCEYFEVGFAPMIGNYSVQLVMSQ